MFVNKEKRAFDLKLQPRSSKSLNGSTLGWVKYLARRGFNFVIRHHFVTCFQDLLFDSGVHLFLDNPRHRKEEKFRRLDLMGKKRVRTNLIKSWVEFDDNGLAVVHHMVVADKPLLNQGNDFKNLSFEQKIGKSFWKSKLVRIFCEADPQLLELKVRDQHQFTPLLLRWALFILPLS